MEKAISHNSRDHALLSASSAYRWLECTPSACLEDRLPNKTSVDAAKGTLAHELCEARLLFDLKRITKADYNSRLKIIKDNELFMEEMITNAEEYSSYVIERIVDATAEVLVEERLDFSSYAPDGFGTGDAVIIQDNTLIVIDYKNGRGKKVDSKDNPQMKLYGLGAIDAYHMVYDFNNVEMCIFQPNINNITSYTMSVDELILWGSEVVKPLAEIAYAGEGSLKAGSHCDFCRHATQCKALYDYTDEIIREEFEDETGKLNVEMLSTEDIAMIIERSKVITDWLSAVDKYALEKVLAGELEIPGYKVVEANSKRVISDATGLEKALVKEGYKKAILYEKKMLGLTALEKIVGKTKFTELSEGYIDKPKGKPKFAPLSSKLPVYTLANEFENLNGGKENE